MFIPFPLPAQVGERYIEVTGTSEIEVVPDRIHYVIEIREYFEEEFDGVSKPEEYRTKVPLTRIEEELKQVLKIVGVPREAIRTKDAVSYTHLDVYKRQLLPCSDPNGLNLISG